MTKGRPSMNKELIAAERRLAVVNSGLVACYETIEEGKRQQVILEAKIKWLRLHQPDPS